MNWHAEYALLMAASTVVTYACALLVSRFEKQKTRKLVLIAGIVFNVGLLGYFKSVSYTHLGSGCSSPA